MVLLAQAVAGKDEAREAESGSSAHRGHAAMLAKAWQHVGKSTRRLSTKRLVGSSRKLTLTGSSRNLKLTSVVVAGDDAARGEGAGVGIDESHDHGDRVEEEAGGGNV